MRLFYLLTFTVIILSIGNVFAQKEILTPHLLEQEPLYTSLEKASKHPKKVYKLKISKSEAKNLNVKKFSNLQYLDISGCDLTNLPIGITTLDNLERLDVSSNQITGLPTDLIKLKRLYHLNLSHNQIQTFPKEVLGLSLLQHLNLSSNKITSIPSQVGELKDLKELWLVDNQITDIPSKPLARLIAIEGLEVRENPLNDWILLAKDLSKAKVYHSLEEALQSPLKVYRLELHNLTTLSKDIEKLPHLQSLVLNNNYLKTLPAEIGNLSKIQQLSLLNNQLQSLPESISKLQQLKELDLGLNPLKELPQSIGSLHCPKRLEIYLI